MPFGFECIGGPNDGQTLLWDYSQPDERVYVATPNSLGLGVESALACGAARILGFYQTRVVENDQRYWYWQDRP